MKNDPYILAGFLKEAERDHWRADGTNPLVTISRQIGAQGEAIALRTAEILTKTSQGKPPWVVVDKDLAERVIEDHHLPKQISSFFTEEQTLSIDQYIEGILGISVPAAARIHDLTRTIVKLARIGHVIFVGRAANLITANYPCAVHVRIIGSFDRRAEHVAEIKNCSVNEAAVEVRAVDEHRHHFVSKYFQANIDDSMHYDMIFNMDRLSVDEGASMIAHLISSPEFRKQAAMKLRELRHQVLNVQ